MFDSWNGRRAKEYRRLNAIPDAWGTAVNVQQMVFGNKGESSGSGVAFSRDEMTGAPGALRRLPRQRPGRGRRLGRAQHRRPRRDGEAAARGARPAARGAAHPRAALRRHAGHRVHRRGGPALPAADAQRQAPGAGAPSASPWTPSPRGCSTRRPRSQTIDAAKLDALLHPTFDPAADYEVLARGVAASPGAAKGAIVFTAEEAVRRGGGRGGRDPGPAVHRGRGRGGLRGGEGDPHLGGRQGIARGAGRAGDGAALRVRRVRPGDRPRARCAAAWTAASSRAAT